MDVDIGLQTRDFKLKHVRFIEAEPGTFEGYASTFGNVDAYGDVFQRGCFRQSVSTNPTRPLLWAHSMSEPIGVVTLEEDSKGLRARGKIVLETQRGREAYELLKAGAVQAMSIGFRPRDFQRTETGLKFTEVEVVETSLVPVPANSEAKILKVKSIGEAKMQEVNSKIADLEQKFVGEIDGLKDVVTTMQKQLDSVDLKLQGGGPSMERGNGDFGWAFIRAWGENKATFEKGGRALFSIDAPWLTRTVTRPSVLPQQNDSRIGAAAAQPLSRLLDALPKASMDSAAVYSVKETSSTGWTAGIQATEGAAKATSDATFTAQLVEARTIATIVSASKQVLDDFPTMEQFVRSRLEWAVLRKLEEQIVSGDGTGANFSGLLTVAAAWTAPSGTYDLYARISYAAAEIENRGYQPSVLLLHPSALLKIRLQVDQNRQYVAFPYELPQMITSTFVPQNQFVLFDPEQFLLRIRQQLQIDVSFDHADYFAKNLVAIRAELRAALQVFSADAAIKGTWPS
jgi:HK97 family phage prohead protease